MALTLLSSSETTPSLFFPLLDLSYHFSALRLLIGYQKVVFSLCMSVWPASRSRPTVDLRLLCRTDHPVGPSARLYETIASQVELKDKEALCVCLCIYMCVCVCVCVRIYTCRSTYVRACLGVPCLHTAREGEKNPMREGALIPLHFSPGGIFYLLSNLSVYQAKMLSATEASKRAHTHPPSLPPSSTTAKCNNEQRNANTNPRASTPKPTPLAPTASFDAPLSAVLSRGGQAGTHRDSR